MQMTVENKSRSSTATKADWEQFLGNWTWQAAFSLVTAPDFNPSPKWIASRLNISVEKAVEAIEGLERIGSIVRSGSSYVAVDNSIQITSDVLSRDQLFDAQSKIAPQLLSKLQPSDAFTHQFFIADKQIIKEYAKKFMALFDEMMKKGEEKKCTDVIAAQISFVQLTGSQEEGAQ